MSGRERFTPVKAKGPRLSGALLGALSALLAATVVTFSRGLDGRATQDAGAKPQGAQPPAAETHSLTPQERRGRALYTRGATESGREIAATIGESGAPASTVACAACHGARGEGGKTEDGFAAGNITWTHLIKPGGHKHPNGRRHAQFDEKSFARAVAEGFDPDDNELLVAMPRYTLTRDEMADLVAYLKRVGTNSDPGATDASRPAELRER